MTLQHIVLFSFPRELSEDEAAQMRGMVASWPSEIGLMTKCRFGTDLTGARTRGYGYLLYTEFPDVATMEAYRAHPVHQRFLRLADRPRLHAAGLRLLPRLRHRPDAGERRGRHVIPDPRDGPEGDAGRLNERNTTWPKPIPP